MTTLSLPSLDQARSILQRSEYALDPVRWVHERLGEHTWSKQEDILNSVRDNRRTAVYTCHNIGKSWTAARLVAWWLETHPLGRAFVVTSAPTQSQVRAILWREIGRAHAKGKLVGRVNQTEWHATMHEGNEEIVAFGRKTSDVDPTAFLGIHAEFVLVVFDEASGMPSTLFGAADTLISNEQSRWICIGNPDDPLSHFARICKPHSGWNVLQIGADDTPNLTGEPIPRSMAVNLISQTWINEIAKDYGKDSPYYIAKVDGQFPEDTTDGLIPLRWIVKAQQRELKPGLPIELGVDVGRGGDKSVTCKRAGSVARIIRSDNFPDTMRTCGNVILDLESTGASIAKVDEIGIGAGVVDRAKEQGKPVVGINVGSAPSKSRGKGLPRFINLRAEGYWQLRERFQDGDIDLDMDDSKLAAQLASIRYKPTSSGKIQIESKDEMRRRGLSSPDEADALMLSFIDSTQRRQGQLTWGRT